MKIVTVNLGDKQFRAAKLTLAEFSEVTKTISEIRAACADGDFTRLEAVVRELAEIVCGSIVRAGSTITVEEIADLATPEEISEAVGLLMSLGTSSVPQISASKPN